MESRHGASQSEDPWTADLADVPMAEVVQRLLAIKGDRGDTRLVVLGGRGGRADGVVSRRPVWGESGVRPLETRTCRRGPVVPAFGSNRRSDAMSHTRGSRAAARPERRTTREYFPDSQLAKALVPSSGQVPLATRDTSRCFGTGRVGNGARHRAAAGIYAMAGSKFVYGLAIVVVVGLGVGSARPAGS